MTLRDEANALSLGARSCADYALWWLTHKRLIPQKKWEPRHRQVFVKQV